MLGEAAVCELKERPTMTIQTLRRWGNSLAVRIPADMAARVRITEGQTIEVDVEDGAVTVRPHTSIRPFSRTRYLQQLRAGRREQHPLIDFGVPHEPKTGGGGSSP